MPYKKSFLNTSELFFRPNAQTEEMLREVYLKGYQIKAHTHVMLSLKTQKFRLL